MNIEEHVTIKWSEPREVFVDLDEFYVQDLYDTLQDILDRPENMGQDNLCWPQRLDIDEKPPRYKLVLAAELRVPESCAILSGPRTDGGIKWSRIQTPETVWTSSGFAAGGPAPENPPPLYLQEGDSSLEFEWKGPPSGRVLGTSFEVSDDGVVVPVEIRDEETQG